MALQFNPPPQDLLNSYLNRKQPAEIANEGIQGALQTYMQMKQQQQQQAFQQKVLASQDAERKAKEFGAIAPYIPEAQIPSYAQSMGLNIPNQTPMAQAPSGAQPNFSSASGQEQMVAPSGSPIIDHFQSMMGTQSAASPGGPMGPRPTSKFGLDKYQKNLAMNKLEQDVAPKEMYDQAGNYINTIPANAQVVPTQKPVVTPEDKESAKRQAKLNAERPKAKGSLTATLHEYDNMISAARSIAADKNLGYATGVTHATSGIPGTPGRNVAANIHNLKSKTLLNVLSSLKQLSANGASGFGALSLPEKEAIENSISALDQGQSTEQFKSNLEKFAQEMEFRKQNLQNTYQDTYGEQMGSAPQATSTGGWSYVGRK